MPIFYQQDIDECTKLAVWKITETEEFFLSEVPLQRAITHPQKRLQHLAGRYLLKYLFADFPLSLIRIADTRKPFLHDEVYHFSISHCGDFAAAIVSKKKRVGVDIELVSKKVTSVLHKFLSDEEQLQFSSALNDQPQCYATLFWSCKEAVFKWYGLGSVDFRKHIVVKQVTGCPNHCYLTSINFNKNEDLYLDLHSQFLGGVCLSYVVTGT